MNLAELAPLAAIALIVAVIVYWLHTAKGKAELDALEARLKLHTSTTVANAPATPPAPPQAAQPIEVHIHQPDSAPAPVAPPSPPPLTPQQAQNLLLYGNIMGPSQGQAGSGSVGVAPVAPSPGDNPVNRPPYPSYWQLDMVNGSSATSVPFTLPAGSYRVDATDGFANGQCAASIAGIGAVIGGSVFTVQADLATSMTAVAVPGNPNSPNVRFGAQINKTA